jgi:hypothetical protein
MKAAAQKLNLKGHYVGLKHPSAKKVYGPADIECHLGKVSFFLFLFLTFIHIHTFLSFSPSRSHTVYLIIKSFVGRSILCVRFCAYIPTRSSSPRQNVPLSHSHSHSFSHSHSLNLSIVFLCFHFSMLRVSTINIRYFVGCGTHFVFSNVK